MGETTRKEDSEMEILKNELKKIFVHEKGFIIIVTFFLYKIVSFFIFDQPVNYDMYQYQDEYEPYLEEIDYKVTAKTEEFITSESKKIAQAHSTIQKLNESYFNGDIPKEQYNADIKEAESVIQREKGFNVLMQQYFYANNNSQQRYLLQYNGWAGLLSKEEVDVAFVLMIIMLVLPIFCEEYSCNMDMLLITSSKGGSYTIKKKIQIAIVLSVCLSIVNSITEVILYGMKYGLDHGNFPLQSLEYYAQCSKNISIIQAYLGVSILRIIGVMYLSIILILLSVIIKRYALIFFCMLSGLLIPCFIFGNETIKYHLCLPIGLLLGVGYFRGSESLTSEYALNETILFQEITNKELMLHIMIILIIYVVIRKYVINANTNQWCK